MLPSSSLLSSSARGRLLTLAAGCLLALPGVASADVTVSTNGTTVTVTGTEGADYVDVLFQDGELSFNGSATAGAGCTKDEYSGFVTCPHGPGGVDINLGGGDDHVSSSVPDSPGASYVRFDFGAGNDFFEGNPGAETVQGGPGNDDLRGQGGDDVLDGGDGNDKVDGGDGADTIRGGAGDDTLKSDPMDIQKADVIDGGPGRDTITDWMWGDPATAPMPTVTLDGAADDGFAGEGDNVTNMEIVESYGGLRFVGTDGDDLARASEVGSKADLSGKGGNDELWATDRDDKLDGGAGDDKLVGRYGNDTIVGGPGKDTIMGDRDGRCNEMHCDLSPGSAADTIDAVDGEADIVSCGPGQDTVKADAIDTVDPDCEAVTRTGASGGAGGGGTSGGAGGSGSGAGSGTSGGGAGGAAKLAVAGKPTLRALLRSGLKVTVSGRAPGAKVTLSLKKGAKVLAKGSANSGTNGTVRITLKLSKAARKSLSRAKSATLTLVAGGDKLTLKLKR